MWWLDHKKANQEYHIMEDLAFTGTHWTSERSSGKKATGIYKVDSLTTFSPLLAALAQKVD